MRPGDIITSVENKPIQSAQEITKHVSDSQPNTRLKFHVLRGEQEKNITVTVQKVEDVASLPPSESVPLPIVVTGPLGFVLDGNTVQALSSTAKSAGLQVGDVITQIQYIDVSTQKDADDWLKKNKDFENVGVFYTRKGEAKFVVLPRTTDE
jgi:S1-C subfamily serine protease